MKKQILNLGKALNKAEQREVNGGRGDGPCGKTGGMVINYSQEQCFGYGEFWYNNQCWACY